MFIYELSCCGFEFYPLYDFSILVQIYQLIIQFNQARLTQKLAAKMLPRRYQNSHKSENSRTLAELQYFFQKYVGNMIHHYNCQAFIILVLFTVPFYHFLFSRYLGLTKCHFSSDILVPFPDLSNLYSHDIRSRYDTRLIIL